MKINETTRSQTIPLRLPPSGDPTPSESVSPKGDSLAPGLSSNGAPKSGLGEEAMGALLKRGDAILRKPESANGLHDTARLEQAIAQDAAKENEKINALPAPQKEQYQALKGLVADDKSQVRALQQLLVDGRLDEKLLGTLSTLAKQPVAEGLDPQELVGQTLEELADPTCINQKNRNTCGAASTQILLAKQDTSEYVRLVSGLASPEGKVTLKNGDTLVREPGTEKPDDSKRTASSRLMQAAFMEYANGTDDYDNVQDLSTGGKSYTGLYAQQMDKLLEATTGTKFDTTIVDKDPTKAMQQLTDAVGQGKIVPILFEYPDVGGHFVNVTGVTKEKVQFINPWGQEEDLDRQTVQNNLWAVSVPQETAKHPFHLPSLSNVKSFFGNLWHQWFKK